MLGGMLCRICRCFADRPREREPAAEPASDTTGKRPAAAKGEAPDESAEDPVDDLTIIHGIGITVRDRLNRAGITTYTQLAKATPERVREALGKSSRGAKVEAWISQARELVASK